MATTLSDNTIAMVLQTMVVGKLEIMHRIESTAIANERELNHQYMHASLHMLVTQVFIQSRSVGKFGLPELGKPGLQDDTQEVD